MTLRNDIAMCVGFLCALVLLYVGTYFVWTRAFALHGDMETSNAGRRTGYCFFEGHRGTDGVPQSRDWERPVFRLFYPLAWLDASLGGWVYGDWFEFPNHARDCRVRIPGSSEDE
ncbi:MAG: hypothetical protein ISS74_10850 [Planctomycetes bacterium]|nr:hypothetical protein [Planctomycetota bacterium]